jgi:outer membrane lipase/esterase
MKLFAFTRSKCRTLALVIAVTAWIGSAQAVTYTGLTFFGDSVSDTGNVLSLTTAFAPPPFPNFPGAPGRFSNGPVWAETLAAAVGFSTASAPSNQLFTGAQVIPVGPLGGQNYSFGGARTGLGGSAAATTGLFGQLVAWNGATFSTSLSRAADPNALYVLMFGGDDMRDFRSGVGGALNPLQAAGNVLTAVGLLAQAGAQHFLISNLNNLGHTPEAVLLGLVPQSTAVSLAFNAALAVGEAQLDAQFLAATGINLDLRTLDLFGLGEAIFDDAVNNGGAVFGIMNVTAPCIGPAAGVYFSPGSVDINCAVSAFSDPLHPTAAVHRLIGDAATVAAGVPQVPEASKLALMLGGLAVVGAVARRRQRK